MAKRERLLSLLRKYLKTENTVKHLIATEAVMRALARRLGPPSAAEAMEGKGKEEEYGLVGLLHDIDYEQELGDRHEKHGKLSVEILKRGGVELPKSVENAIVRHNYEVNGAGEPKTFMDWSLFICDSLTGLIVACALVQPGKKLASVKVKSVKKKFKSPAFAAGTRREEILLCEEKLGMTLDELIGISLTAMQGVAEELGL
jgi:putative nucleotidyltransferase with HDIG domain